jgi:hypothetical protein
MPPRPIRPKDEVNSTDGVDSAAETKSSKRRAVSSACIPCRKRKSKVSLTRMQDIVTLADMSYSVTVVDHRAQHALLYIGRNASTTKTATIAEKVH